ncbi:hypothetical protein [Bradyrhizobium sp.]|uniref:hypothetical protein n=1 Tax=Bradyrhizobium sp. TaxID=376 RepID=UPI0039E6E246
MAGNAFASPTEQAGRADTQGVVDYQGCSFFGQIDIGETERTAFDRDFLRGQSIVLVLSAIMIVALTIRGLL